MVKLSKVDRLKFSFNIYMKDKGMGLSIIFGAIITVFLVQIYTYTGAVDWVFMPIPISALNIGFIIGFIHCYMVISPMINEYEERKYLKEKYPSFLKKINKIN